MLAVLTRITGSGAGRTLDSCHDAQFVPVPKSAHLFAYRDFHPFRVSPPFYSLDRHIGDPLACNQKVVKPVGMSPPPGTRAHILVSQNSAKIQF